MKIGAGGLQSLLHHDNITIKQVEPGRGRVVPDEQLQNQSLAHKKVTEAELVKIVDRLNKAAQMFNYPLKFKVFKDKDNKLKVKVFNTQTGETQEMEPEQAQKFADQRESTSGKKFDDYA
ncbi:flagellar protein FlaG [Peptococcaceae bacterium 1198_IL3148]